MRLVQIAEEIVSVLVSDANASVKVVVEISAEFPEVAKDLPFGDWVNHVEDARNRYAATHNLPVWGGTFNWQDLTTLHSQAINREL
jgi:hypothetical protein